jgi:hypothetical protein
MATRSPTQTHSYWGSFTLASGLPSGDARLQSGDTAYAEDTDSLYAYDGAAWQAVGITQLTADVTAGPGSGSLAATVVALQGNPLSSVTPADGQVLTWNGSAWVPGAPASGGSGGGGQVYFLNNGVPAQIPAPAGTPYELGLVASGTATSITSGTLTGSYSLVAGFVTQLNVPGLDAIPAGVWDFNVWAGASTATPNAVVFRISVYAWTGTNSTFVATGAATPLYDPTQTLQYVSTVLVPQTLLSTTDRIYVEVEATSTVGGDITFGFGGITPTHVHTTLPSVAGTGLVHVINGVIQSPASAVNLAGEVTGTLPIANGGTALATTPTDGQLLIGNGANYTLATLSAGSGISITNAPGAISIAATNSGAVTSVTASAPLASSGGATPDISLTGIVPVANGGTALSASPSNGQLLIGNGTSYSLATLTAGTNVTITNGSGSVTIDASGGGGGAVFAGSLTVYVDPTNGTDAPGGGTLGAPYASINYAYSQVTSLGAPANTIYTPGVEQFVVEKLVFQLAPGRYVENVLLGFKRARVQLIGNGVQIIGSVTMRAVRADFPAASMEALKASFPAPYTGAGMLATFEITGQAGGGVEADATADPLVVTGLSTLLFDEPTVPGLVATGTAWDNNYGQFNFYANKANLIGGQVISTSYVTTPFRGLGTCVIEIDGSTIGEASTPVRSYLGAVPYAYAASPTLWNTGTGVATGAQSVTTLQDTSKTWTVGQWIGATVLLTSGTGATQTRTVISNSATTLTISSGLTNWATTPVAGSTVYSLITPAGTATGVQSSTTLQDTSKTWTVNQYAGAQITLTGGTGAPQTRIIASNTADTLTVSSAWTTTPVSGSTVYSVAYNVPEGVITLKTHSSTLGASVGPRLTLGELDGCRIYDLDQTMLGTVGNGGVTGSTSSSYIGSVVNQYRQYSGTGIPPSQYQIGSNLAGTRYKFDSTSYTTIAFNRSSSTGVLTARTLNLPTNTGTATAGAATTLTDTSKVWTTNRWAGGTLTLTGGTGSGQTRTISSNTATAITVSPAWTTNPAAGTTYTVTALAAFDFQDDSRSLAYTPTTGANWLDPDPSTVGSALDKVGALGLLAAVPTNGQIPIGNGTNFTLGFPPISTALNGSSPTSTSTFIGAVYVPASITLSATSRAYIGTSNAGVVTLTLQTPAAVTAATFTSASITGFADVLITGTPTLAAGWYNIVLTADAVITTAFARGLYLV